MQLAQFADVTVRVVYKHARLRMLRSSANIFVLPGSINCPPSSMTTL
jgi:hypothetical protein